MREYLANPTHPAEHTTLEFSFPVTAAFLIPAREALGSGDPNDKKTPFSYSLFKKSAVSVVDALHNIPDPKEVSASFPSFVLRAVISRSSVRTYKLITLRSK